MAVTKTLKVSQNIGRPAAIATTTAPDPDNGNGTPNTGNLIFVVENTGGQDEIIAFSRLQVVDGEQLTDRLETIPATTAGVIIKNFPKAVYNPNQDNLDWTPQGDPTDPAVVATVTGVEAGPFAVVLDTNDKLRIAITDDDVLATYDVVLTAGGARTRAQIAADINAEIGAVALASDITTGVEIVTLEASGNATIQVVAGVGTTAAVLLGLDTTLHVGTTAGTNIVVAIIEG